MNSNRNLIVALLAIWCYTRNCNINLANNTAILLILYALLSRNNGAVLNNLPEAFAPAARPFRQPAPFPFAHQPYQATPCCPVF